jgi:hypothetical protein
MRTSHFPDWRGGAKNGQFRLGVAAGIVGDDRLSIVLAARDTSAIERSITRSVLGLPLLGQPRIAALGTLLQPVLTAAISRALETEPTAGTFA